MGLTRKEAEAVGMGHLFPEPVRGKSKRAPHERFAMNRTESRFAAALEGQKLCKEILGWAFEMDTFVLAPDMQYTPDFRVETNDRLYEFVDVKGGHVWEDSIVKGKTAAVLFPYHRFYLAFWVADRVRPNGKFVAAHWRYRRLGITRGKGSG